MDLTIFLVGPTGHGKSATGNSILGKNAFRSRARSSSVTVTCELQTSVLEDGHTISVIDTPWFFDKQSDLLGEEVKKCINLARNGIHAILFVVSVGRWFSKEDQIVAIRNLQIIFGKDIINYMIVVFTGGDEVDTLSLPSENHDVLRLCEGRSVRFNNWTEDEVKRSEQVQNLLSQVKTVISDNGGKPFMSQVFEIELQAAWRLIDIITEAQAAASTVDEGAKESLKEEISEQIDKSFEERMTQITNVVESTVRDATTRLQQQLVETHETTMNAEEISKLIQQLNESNQEQTTQRIDAVEARLRDTTTSLEQQLEAATLRADEGAEKYFKEATSELIQRISKSYEEQIMQRLEAAVEQRVLDMATRLEQQLAEAHAAQMKVNEIAQQQMTQRINEEVESRVKDVTTKLEQQLEEAEAARLKADERAQEAQKNSDEQIQKLKEVFERAEKDRSRRSETILEFGSSSFHVYDPSTYELQISDDITTCVRLLQLYILKCKYTARLKADERAQEAQKNSDEQIQKLKEVFERAEQDRSRRSETILEFGSSSFHVYDPSSYELQRTIK